MLRTTKELFGNVLNVNTTVNTVAKKSKLAKIYPEPRSPSTKSSSGLSSKSRTIGSTDLKPSTVTRNPTYFEYPLYTKDGEDFDIAAERFFRAKRNANKFIVGDVLGIHYVEVNEAKFIVYRHRTGNLELKKITNEFGTSRSVLPAMITEQLLAEGKTMRDLAKIYHHILNFITYPRDRQSPTKLAEGKVRIFNIDQERTNYHNLTPYRARQYLGIP